MVSVARSSLTRSGGTLTMDDDATAGRSVCAEATTQQANAKHPISGDVLRMADASPVTLLQLHAEFRGLWKSK
jgi:hypothetical protein